MSISKFVGIAVILLTTLFCQAQEMLQTKNTEAVLYLGSTEQQPLVVGLGGSEGGNAWTSDYWKATREQFVKDGYAFLAIGYFGCKGTPAILDKIAIDDVYAAIMEATKNTKINKNKIAVIGGSRGADLALLLASYYQDIDCVVGMSSSHAVFPGHTLTFDSSCWTFNGNQLPFVPVNEEAVPFLIKRDLRGAFETMLKDKAAEQNALIKVENINGPILLLSATKDEMIPAVDMGDKMMARLKEHHFRHYYKQLIFEGFHAEPTQHFDEIFRFLEQYFK